MDLDGGRAKSANDQGAIGEKGQINFSRCVCAMMRAQAVTAVAIFRWANASRRCR